MKKIKNLSFILLFLLLIFSVSIPTQAESKVKISKTKQTLYTGQSTTLKIKGTNKKASWTSTNKKVATVTKKGKVTAKKSGTATIVAKVSNKKYKCKITVKNPSLNKTDETLYVGTSTTLKLDNVKKIAWTSSNKKVATVTSKGKVTAKGTGTATITAKAYGKKYKCEITVKEQHTHNYSLKVTTQATCTTKGINTYTCSCGDSYNEEIAIKPHTSGIWEVLKNATCLEEGKEIQKCTVCNLVLNTRILATSNHKYTTVVTGATCTEQGYTTHVCSCGDSFIDTFTNAKHKWSDWNTVNEATATETGLKKRICSGCGTVETESIPSIGHKHVYSSVVTEPNCVERGYTTYSCSCGYSYNSNYTEALNHDYDFDNGTIVEEGTCIAIDRITTYQCSRCDSTITSESRGDHKYEWIRTEPTCTEDGEEGYLCKYCGDRDDFSTLKAAHSYSDWTILKQPADGVHVTVDDFGNRERICSVCKHVDEQTIINIDLGNGETKQLYGTFADEMAYETLALVNELRASVGVGDLTWLTKWEGIGKIRAVELTYSYGHTKPNGDKARYNGIGLGENIWGGYNVTAAKIAVDGWATSEGHYSNMVKEQYQAYYCSCFIDTYGWYWWVQLFY